MYPIRDVARDAGPPVERETDRGGNQARPRLLAGPRRGRPGSASGRAGQTSEAMHYDGSVKRISHPRHRGHLLSFESGANPWYDYDHLVGLLDQAKDRNWREHVADDLLKLFRRWRWRGTNDPLIASGLVLATWVQAVWAWRPRIDLLGATNTGKSMLCAALAGLFRDLVILTSDTTAAGLRQKNPQLRSRRDRRRGGCQEPGQGRAATRNPGNAPLGQPGHVRDPRDRLWQGDGIHPAALVWVAGISLSYDDQADRNRAIIFNLLRPEGHGRKTPPSNRGRIARPRPAGLGGRSVACQAARTAAVALKDQRIEGSISGWLKVTPCRPRCSRGCLGKPTRTR